MQLLRRIAWKISAALDPIAGLAALFREFHAPLFRYACSLTARRALAEDAVQEVFLELASDPQKIKQMVHPQAYLYRAVRNQVLKSQLRHGNEWTPLDELEAFPCPNLSTEERSLILAALRLLPESQREVLFLKEVLQLSFREIAEILEIPLNTAASRHRYGLASLREKWQS